MTLTTELLLLFRVTKSRRPPRHAAITFHLTLVSLPAAVPAIQWGITHTTYVRTLTAVDSHPVARTKQRDAIGVIWYADAMMENAGIEKM